MSTPSQVTPPTAPGLTTPGTDSIIRSVTIAISSIITGIILAWLNSKGFATTDITFLGQTISPSVLIGTAVFTTMLGLVSGVWGWLRGSQVGRIITTHEVAAVNAGMALADSGQMKRMGTGTGVSVPVLATADTAKEIIKNFAPVIQEQGTK